MGERGGAPVIGLVLLIGFVTVGALAVFASGSVVIESAESGVEETQIERSMLTTAETADSLSRGERSDATWSFESGGPGTPRVVEQGAGKVSLIHYVGGSAETTVLENASMGALVYEADGTEYAYQAGAVWRLDENGATQLVRAPKLHYRGGTLTFPFVNVTGDVTAGSETGRMSVTESQTVYPRGEDQLNPLQNGTVVIRISSRYCEGWQSYFDQRTDGALIERCGETDGTAEGEMEIELVVPFELPEIRGAVEAETINLPSGGGGPPGGGPPGGGNSGPPGMNPPGSGGSSGPPGGNSNGTSVGAAAGKSAAGAPPPAPDIEGDVYVEDPDSVDESRVDGGVYEKDRTIPSASDLVRRKVDRCDGFVAPGGVVDSSTACIDQIDGSLVVDTTDGPVDIVVRDAVDLGGGDDIVVQGPGAVTVFVDGDVSAQGNQHVGNDSNPLQTRFFVSDNGTVEVQNSNVGHFSAFTYAPDSTVLLFGQGTGGPVIADHVEVQNPNPNGPAARHDGSMGSVDIEYEYGGPEIYYLHVTETEVQFDGT